MIKPTNYTIFEGGVKIETKNMISYPYLSGGQHKNSYEFFKDKSGVFWAVEKWFGCAGNFNMYEVSKDKMLNIVSRNKSIFLTAFITAVEENLAYFYKYSTSSSSLSNTDYYFFTDSYGNIKVLQNYSSNDDLYSSNKEIIKEKLISSDHNFKEFCSYQETEQNKLTLPEKSIVDSWDKQKCLDFIGDHELDIIQGLCKIWLDDQKN